ncbi:hypothetical protein BC829DRAFT_85856 [Chytridium lagenaria]|nr:hypothetical protein BC829DRAFT_85856 [Chytridium lagenaria]
MSEIYDNWNAINILSGVPANEITGFRHPFLNYSRSTYDAIYELREYIKYESSVVLDPNTQGYWPHTLDYGMPVNPPNCNNCDEGSRWRYPGMFLRPGVCIDNIQGLWLIPMYALMTNSSPPAVWSAMDIVIDPAKSTTYEEAAANLRASFLMHYDKRLPFGLYQHVAQYIAWPKDVQDRKTELVIDFIRWTQTFRNVWYVTNQQLLQWIADPKPVDALGNLFTCGQNDDYKTEVCDGFDNDENGQIDESLVLSCTYGNQSFQSCFGCPDKFQRLLRELKTYLETEKSFQMPGALQALPLGSYS